MVPDAGAAIDAVYRSDWGRIVAALIRLVGDFEMAEEAAQEAFAAAVSQWRTSGVPESPRSWIIQTARRLDLITTTTERRFLDRRLREVQGRASGALGCKRSAGASRQ